MNRSIKIGSGGTTVDIFDLDKKKKNEFIKTSESNITSEIDVSSIIEKLTKENMNLLKSDSKDADKLLHNKINKIIRENALDKSSKEIFEEIKSQVYGYGIVDSYIKDPSVNNIYINNYDDIWIQRGLERIKVKETFKNANEVALFIRIMNTNLGGEINRDKATATLNDKIKNLRIICVIDPIASRCPTVVIRKHQNINENLNINKLIEYEMLTKQEASFLIEKINNGSNVIFSGIGGSGKTTLLRALLNQLKEEKRVMTMEESLELNLIKSNVLPYEIRRNSRGKTIGLSELIELGLKSSIDLFVFGETRGEEALSLYDAAFSGHQVITTLHTRSHLEVTERLLINMKKSGTDIPSDILIAMVYKSIDYVVHMDKLKVINIAHMGDGEANIIDLNKVG